MDRAGLVVHLDRLSDNIDLLREKAPTNEIIFMAKASAYGHGAISVAQFTHREKGINDFGVATLEEACELRDALGGDRPKILLFSGPPLKESLPVCVEKKPYPRGLFSGGVAFLFKRGREKYSSPVS